MEGLGAGGDQEGLGNQASGRRDGTGRSGAAAPGPRGRWGPRHRTRGPQQRALPGVVEVRPWPEALRGRTGSKAESALSSSFPEKEQREKVVVQAGGSQGRCGGVFIPGGRGSGVSVRWRGPCAVRWEVTEQREGAVWGRAVPK